MRWIAVALLMSGCVTAPSAVGDRTEWTEVRTEHFRVRAQADAQTATALGNALEDLRAGVAAYWGINPKDRLELVAYRDASALAEFTAAPGFVHQGSSGAVLVTTLDGAHDPAFVRMEAHELTHLLGAYFMPRQPRWLAEGLAQYLETLDLTVAPGKATYGRPSGTIKPDDLSARPLTLAQLWDWTTDDTLPAERTGWAWWAVHFLADHHGERFDLWQRSMARGEEARPSFDRAFAGLPPEKLEADMLEGIRARKLEFPSAPLPAGERAKPEVARADEAELYALRAELLLQSSPLEFEVRRVAATAALDAALALDPRNADALVLKARLIPDPAQARAFAQGLVGQLPQSAKAWGYLASILGREGEDPRETLQFALALAPDHPGLLNTLAWYAALYGDRPNAVKAAERAVALRPWSAAMVDTQAAVLGAAGRCPEAAARQRQALDLLVHGPLPQRTAYLSRLKAYETACTRQTPTALTQ